MKTVHMPDGRLVRLEAQDGPPTEPGLYLAEYTPRHGEPHSIAREVRIDRTGTLDYGPDSARLEWWARIVDEAPGGALSGGGATDGEAGGALDADLAEPSTLGREGDWWTRVQVTRAELALLLGERDALRARVAELEAGRRWIPVSERLPEEGVGVLAYGAAEYVTAWWDGRHFRDPHGLFEGITHWRPLPAGPEEQP